MPIKKNPRTIKPAKPTKSKGRQSEAVSDTKFNTLNTVAGDPRVKRKY